MLDLANLWEWAGVSFGKEETFLLFLSIKKLVETKQLKSVRLWGKIYGCDQNYIIAEGELKDGAQDEDDAIANPPQPEKSEKKEEKNTKVNLPKPKVFAPLSKETRSGVNKYVYYCTNSVGGAWTRLPDVIPERLQESRKIHKYFTGHLDHQVHSF
jgi:radial spoke head protein 4A